MCGLGDAVWYLAFLRAIRSRFLHAEIVVVVATNSASLILGNVAGVEVIVFNRSTQKGKWWTLARLVWSFRQRRFDLVISGAHPNSVRVPLFAFLTSGKLRIGARSERLSFLYNRRVDVSTNAHYVDRYQQLLHEAGITIGAEDSQPLLQPPANARSSALRLWNDAGLETAALVIGMVSGADVNTRAGWQPNLKRWHNQGFADVARWAALEWGARIAVIGSADEAPIADDIAALSGIPIANFCGKTGLAELQWIIRRCTAIVCNDTGTMHLAGALGTPVVALFGPTSPQSFRPPGEQLIIIEGEASCAPCYPHPTCKLLSCRAMQDISSRHVIDQLTAILTTGDTALKTDAARNGMAR
jgi:lipopolysaccharide heptosyltransferase II